MSGILCCDYVIVWTSSPRVFDSGPMGVIHLDFWKRERTINALIPFFILLPTVYFLRGCLWGF